MASFRDLTEWSSNFTKNDHVQPTETDGGAGNFLSGESAVIVSGPEKLITGDDSNMDKLIPIGLVQQAQLSQNKQINQILEIGSSVPVFIPGRVSVNATLSKILFDGPSLAYALYRSGKAGTGDVTVPKEKQNGDPYSIPASPYPSDGKVVAADSKTPGLFWINLASRMFNKPLGIGFMLYDMEGQAYGGAYLEGCYLRAHNFGISANASVLAENVSLVAQRIRPVKASVMGDASSDFYSRVTPEEDTSDE
jgi:hypothetical protein